MDKKRSIIIGLFLILIISMSFVSAGIFGNLWKDLKTITGKATEGDISETETTTSEGTDSTSGTQTIEDSTNSDKVCCKVYGIGAYGKEVYVHYEWRGKEKCSTEICENGTCRMITGEGREIVDEGYCVQDVNLDEEFTLKKKGEKVKIKHTPITIKCLGYVAETGPEGESPYVILQIENITSNTSKEVSLKKGDSKTVYGDYVLKYLGNSKFVVNEKCHKVSSIEDCEPYGMCDANADGLLMNQTLIIY